MDLMEIILLIVGMIIFILSFFIPDKGSQGNGISKETAKEEIKKMVEAQLDEVRGHVDDVVDEAITYAMEKTERSLERLSNEKIMAVSEYSDTVLADIHKNHQEAMFLYDMLNSKHINLKDTVSEVNRTVKEAEETVSGIKKAIPETTVQQPEEVNVFEPFTVERESIPVTVDFGQETASEGQNHNEKILELYRRGKSTVAIAKELGLGVGEVKLVIGLYKNQ